MTQGVALRRRGVRSWLSSQSLSGYVVRRSLQAIPVMFGVLLVDFLLIHLAPGSPVDLLGGESGLSAEVRERAIRTYGLDQPVPVQFVAYVANALQLNLGYSYRFHDDVLSIILGRLPLTILLAGTAFILSSVVGILLGIYAGRRPHTRLDNVLTLFALAGQSIAVFWLAIILILIFGIGLGWLPISGVTDVRNPSQGLGMFADVGRHLLLPAIVYSVYEVALVYRLMRVKMIEALEQDYVQTARAKGLSERTVTYRYAFPNAFLPVLTVLGFNFGYLLAGFVLIETVFAWPGVGRLTYDAIHARDYALLLGLFTFASFGVIVASLITDVLYAILDPRVVYGSRRVAA
jgi:ABC-type dipeptide/oligopeptide/nickel transport system permease component